MYEQQNSRAYGGLGDWYGLGQGAPYDPYPGYSTDPAQVPIAPGYPYGMPGVGYPGYAFGTRILEMDDALRLARERQIALERRAATSSDASHKYLSAERKLTPAQKVLFDSIKARRREELERKRASSTEGKLMKTVLLGLLVSALFR
jgi:hypothetical protein